MNDELEQLRLLAGPLRLSVEADGAELLFDAYAGGVLEAHLAFADGDEEGREYVLPAAQLTPMLEALLKPRFPGLMRVLLRDPRTNAS